MFLQIKEIYNNRSLTIFRYFIRTIFSVVVLMERIMSVE